VAAEPPRESRRPDDVVAFGQMLIRDIADPKSMV
jgi:hypothetical protein